MISESFRSAYSQGAEIPVAATGSSHPLTFCVSPSDEDDPGRWEEVPAADCDAAEEGADHFPGWSEEAIQTLQGENKGGVSQCVDLFSSNPREKS